MQKKKKIDNNSLKSMPLTFLLNWINISLTEKMSSFFSDNKKYSTVNGQTFGPESVEFDDMEDPSTPGPVIDGEETRLQDPAYYGMEYRLFRQTRNWHFR